MWAACSLGYFAFFRAGEFTISILSQFEPEDLTPRDISVDSHTAPSLMCICLKYSKKDQQRRGVNLCVQ